MAIITVYLAKRPPDKTHPYGHGKTEFIGGVFTGIVLLCGGACVLTSALSHLLQSGPLPKPHFIALVAAVISILVNELLFRWTICAARRVNSAALEAEGWDNRSDTTRIRTELGWAPRVSYAEGLAEIEADLATR